MFFADLGRCVLGKTVPFFLCFRVQFLPLRTDQGWQITYIGTILIIVVFSSSVDAHLTLVFYSRGPLHGLPWIQLMTWYPCVVLR